MSRRVTEAERALEPLLAAYRAAQREIVARIKGAVAAGELRTASGARLQLAAVLAVLDQLGAETDPEARRLVADAYREGADRAAGQAASLGVNTEDLSAFHGVSFEAVRALQDSVAGRLQDARRTIGRQAADVFQRAQRQAAVRALLGADGSPRTASRRMTEGLARQGRTGFVDRAGRRWALDSYADMAVRTITREAAVQGAIARMASHGITLARVSSHASACQLCAPWQGRLVSLDGTAGTIASGEDYIGLGDLPNGGPPMHPRCRHSLAPFAARVEGLQRELAAAGRL